MSFESYPGIPKDCLLCGRKQPSGHVIVFDKELGTAVGRVCSSHTLMEIILNPKVEFDISLVFGGPREEVT